eukprot:3409172-Pleurochrysis_carterae.AAC.2
MMNAFACSLQPYNPSLGLKKELVEKLKREVRRARFALSHMRFRTRSLPHASAHALPCKRAHALALLPRSHAFSPLRFL